MHYASHTIFVKTPHGERDVVATCAFHEGKPLLAYSREPVATMLKNAVFHPTHYEVVHVPTGFRVRGALPSKERARMLCHELMLRFAREFAAIDRQYPAGLANLRRFLAEWPDGAP
jgi:hypothetical protein